MNRVSLIAGTLGLLLSAAAASAQGRLYVDADAAPGGNGTSWAKAYKHPESALTQARNLGGISEIWIASGTYRPIRPLDDNKPRSVTFLVPGEVSMYGGFDGTETELEQRDIAANPTLLTGDILGDDQPDFANTTDNAFNVVRWGDAAPGASFDGFIVKGGSAWEDDADGKKVWVSDPGAGLRAAEGSPRIANCEFSANSGAGLYLRHVSGTAVIACLITGNRSADAAGLGSFGSHTSVDGCTFTQNQPVGFYVINGSAGLSSCAFIANGTGLLNSGGDILADDCEFAGHTLPAFKTSASPGPTILRRSTFRDNSADRGAAIYGPDGDYTIESCRFVGNTAIYDGGAIYALQHGRFTIVSSTFIGNRAIAGDGGALMAAGDGAAINGCLFSGNHAGISGGAIWAPNTQQVGPSTIINCTITDNEAGAFAGGVYCPEGNEYPLTLRNTILWGNTDGISDLQEAQLTGVPAPGYCLIEGWDGELGGTGNSGDDPAFADRPGPDGLFGTEDDDLHAAPGSPMIDAGDNTALPADSSDLDGDGDIAEPLPRDLDAHDRRADDPATPDTGNGPSPVVDIGAFELSPPPCPADINGDGVLDLFDFLGFQNLFVAHDPSADLDGNGSFDLFDFLAYQNLFVQGCN